jgi:hypothetical protein
MPGARPGTEPNVSPSTRTGRSTFCLAWSYMRPAAGPSPPSHPAPAGCRGEHRHHRGRRPDLHPAVRPHRPELVNGQRRRQHPDHKRLITVSAVAVVSTALHGLLTALSRQERRTTAAPASGPLLHASTPPATGDPACRHRTAAAIRRSAGRTTQSSGTATTQNAMFGAPADFDISILSLRPESFRAHCPVRNIPARSPAVVVVTRARGRGGAPTTPHAHYSVAGVRMRGWLAGLVNWSQVLVLVTLVRSWL